MTNGAQSSAPAAPRGGLRFAALVAACAAAAVFVLPLDLSALSSGEELAASWRRLSHYLQAFASPDLSPAMLARCAGLALDTVAVALLGTALGIALAYPIALGASRAVTLGDPSPRRPLRTLVARGGTELCRLLQDVLRGVPDFVWALLLANFVGVSPVTGVLAIAVSVAGIFGKVLSEQWDAVPEPRYRAVRATGASGLQTFLYGIQPHAARTTLSFVLMRTECAVRNASVIGVVGGGGLGAGLWDEYLDGDLRGVATLLLALLVVTASADLVANLVRRRLRVETGDRSRAATRRRRVQVAGLVFAMLVASVWRLGDEFARVVQDLGRIEWQFVRPYTLGLFTPDLSPTTLGAVASAALVPLAIGVLATLLGALLAALLVYPASWSFQLDAHRFTGERPPAPVRVVRVLAMGSARAVALVLRAVPEVGWLVVLMVLLRASALPCVIAVALHTAGVLHRVFTESVDDVRHRELAAVDGGGTRPQRFVYGALPRVWPTWRAYLSFQFEVNVRAGVALGIVGAGGLGALFARNLEFRQFPRAAAFLWGVVVLTVAIDRVGRWLQVRRLRC